MAEKSYSKTSRCWPGFEPVPGKSEHEEGSCRKKAPSKNGGKEVDRETARKKQIAKGGERARQAKAKSPNAEERHSVSKTGPSARTARKSTKKTAARKSATGKTPVRKTAAKRTAAKKSSPKKTAGTR